MSPDSPLLHSMVAKLARRYPLGPSDIDTLLALPHRIARLERGSFLVREGDKATHCRVLLSGFVYRHKCTGEGARQILSIHLRGDLVDLPNVMLDVADDNIQALTDVSVALIPAHEILTLALASPSIAKAMWADTMVDASILREWLLNIGQHNARQRIAHLICELALRQEDAGICDSGQYHWPLTQEQLGETTGLTSVHVNRTLQKLRAERLLRTSGRQLLVADWEGLKVAGDFRSGYLHLASATSSSIQPARSRDMLRAALRHSQEHAVSRPG
ncbi:Crp/Fnr family transcriptional regulator [Sphingomonas cannabina]|uniref:Crp/Fnr family transcriptional regulator n=1 Tax=Sphingomonas cannabina TaxID=2899123 RepID=UPI001F4057B8|nr:Crp/Fnr family transcriptional regulator [Sphingomonas cannabina]UIJ44806.1 Crp/Fnr family transcriptional regulator [Sphingomonas cannabina]